MEKLFARKRILVSYRRAGRYKEALDYLDTFKDIGFKNMESGKLYILSGETEKARIFFQRINSDTAKILKGWTYLQEASWTKSEKVFLTVSDDSNLLKTAASLTQYAMKADKEILQKNILLSALLSSIIPGGGRFYTERPGDGVFSFLSVAIPGFISYIYWREDRKRAFSIAIGFTGLFYIGDIYGSIISAEQFNKVKKREYLEKIEKELRIKERFIQ